MDNNLYVPDLNEGTLGLELNFLHLLQAITKLSINEFLRDVLLEFT